MDNNAADSLFRILDQGKKKSIASDKFFDQLARTGILSDDPRIQELLNNIRLKEQAKRNSPFTTQTEFNGILKQNAMIKKSLIEKLVIPDFASFCKQVEELFSLIRKNEKGKYTLCLLYA
ncbi:hypothetical protein WJR50_31170 [Catalinimonas sp. 4WD22]|uniref:hypothetical protein n=1 Tax=Catalinimonas locisalis TaxID=3133978 RepID=UPI003100C9C7